MKRTYLRGYVLRADDTPSEGGPLRIVAATEGVKGDGLNLTMAGADLARFKANPVVGYGHMYWGRESLPIGRANKTWIDGDKLMMDIVFDQGDEFARTVERKYRDGYLNAFSIGFEVHNVDDQGVPERWELYEVSAVPLPMDPDALVESGRQLALRARAGKVLSKANKKLVKDAIRALQALLAAAGDDDDDDEGDGPDDNDEGRTGRPRPRKDPRDAEIERLRAHNRRLARLAGV